MEPVSPSPPSPAPEPSRSLFPPLERPLPGDRWAQGAIGLAVCGWASACCLSPGLTQPQPQRTFGSEAERQGYHAAKLVMSLAPVGLSGLAVLLGVVALSLGTRRRGNALGGVALGGLHLVAVSIGFLAVMELGPFARGPRPSGPPLTEPEVRVLGTELARRLCAGDGTAFADHLDVEALVERAGLPAMHTRELEQLRGRLSRDQGAVWKEIGRQVSAGGSYRVAGVHLDPAPQLVLRLVGAEGLNYHLLDLVRARDGSVAIADVRTLMGSVQWSRLLRQGADPANRAQLQHVQRMVDRLQANDPSGAVEVFEGLSDADRRTSLTLTLYYRAAGMLGPEAMERALHAIEEAQLPELGLLVFDLHWSRGEFARCEELLEQLQREVRDPYLDAMRANTLVMQGENEQARELALRARDAVPELRETWIALMNASVGCGDHPLSLEAMQHLAGEFGMRPEEIEEGHDLRDFQGSAQGAVWEAWKAAR